MSKPTQDAATESDPILSPQTICAFVEELFRLAKDTKNLVANSFASPRVLSNLTAMKPIISLLSDQGYSTILNPQASPDATADTKPPPNQGVSPAGYL